MTGGWIDSCIGLTVYDSCMDRQLAKTASPGLMITFCCSAGCCAFHVESCQLRGSSTQTVIRPSLLILMQSKMFCAVLRGECQMVNVELCVIEAAGWRLGMY
jgi:hypothetical protein